jgi:acetylornithine deacetylase/succinyl-diaminopimelate desuccinylase-like protein
MKLPYLAAFLLCLATAIAAQKPPETAREYTAAHRSELVQQFSELLSIPNVAADPANLKRNADVLLEGLRKRGIDSRLLSLPGAPSVVFGKIDVPGAQHTIVFYAHYDGQPVTPSEWDDGSPFTPIVREVNGEQRIYARSAGDDKAAIFAQLTAFDALKAGGIRNWAPNPAMMLAQLLAGMKDEDGGVLVLHFHDGIEPLSAAEKEALAHAPVNDHMLMNAFWLGHVDGAGARLLELINRPSLNINGFSSGQTGARAANVIPPTATADLDLRLVVGIDWRGQQQRVIDYIRSRGYFIVDREPTQQTLLDHSWVALVVRDEAGYNAVRTPMDLPIAREVIEAVKGARKDVVLLPTMGGSVPLGAMERAARTRTITVPIANYDDNQHAANENLRLQNLWDGVETMAALLAMK